jgi:hypothetical protein
MPHVPVVFTCDEHSSVYHHLVAAGATGLSLTHLDAHCDLRGTLIDRESGRAWLRQKPPPVSPSTYLSHAVAERIATDLEWVHDEIGGRENDLFTVRYTTDLGRFGRRAAPPPDDPGVEIIYRESAFAAWRYHDEARVLDIDWDFFADFRKSAAREAREIDELLDDKLTVTPQRVYVAYSSQYSRPGRAAYERFVARLARRISGRVESIPEAPVPRAGLLARALPPSLRRVLRAQALRVKRALAR